MTSFHGFDTIIHALAAGNPLVVDQLEDTYGFVRIATSWRHVRAREEGVGFKRKDTGSK